jgi:predicted RNA-binding protein with PUA-like domain
MRGDHWENDPLRGALMYWLLKTEPTTYSFGDLERDKKAEWDGVTNALALKHLREMKVGDQVFVYHTGDEKAVVGTAKVSRAAYPDPKEKDAKLVVVEIKAGRKLKAPVTLAGIKADRRFADWGLVRMGRLSVVPTTQEQWERVLAMAVK